MKRKFSKRAISILLSALMAVSGIVPAMSAFAGDGVEGFYDIQIFYKADGVMVPSYDDDAKEQEHIEYLQEGDELELKYELIDSTWPNNGRVEWSSSSPIVCDVTSEGVVKAFDSSKGAVIKAWLDNEVRTIPLVGNLIAKAIEKVLFNDKVNLDDLDTQGIVDLVTKALGSDSIIADYVEAYQGTLIDSLRKYLDEVNTTISCKLFGEGGSVVAEDSIKVCVTKNENIFANFLPNGTHISNKGNIKTTQAKGSNLQLQATTTPQRLGYGTVFSVKSSSVFTQGKVVATVTDGGLVYFKNVGTATIMASPDSEDVINGLLKFVNYFYKLENTGTLNNDKIADILIKYMGVDINKAVLTALLDSAFAIAKIVGGSGDPVQLTATAAKILANVILQMKYNDSITFNVIESVPLESFEIDNSKTKQVKEGTQLQYNIINVVPDAGDTSDIVWSSSDPSVAMVDPKTGIITGLDAGGALGALSTKDVQITAYSPAKKVSRTVTVTVTGKTGKYISYASIDGADDVDINGEAEYGYQIYPSRVADGNNLYIQWGFKTGENEDGEATYTWATDDEVATDGLATVDKNGKFKPLNGGTSTLAMKAVTGYYLSNGNFYEISSYIATKDVTTGVPVDQIDIKCTQSASNGKIDIDNTIDVNGTKYEYVTIRGSAEYNGEGVKLQAEVTPEEATNKAVTWVSDNPYYVVNIDSNDPNKVVIKCKAGHEVADTFNVYAVSNDGRVKSNVITVCVTKNHANSNTINQKNIEITNGESREINHTLGFDGSWTGGYYACYKANWYSSDEDIFSTESNINSNGDCKIVAKDVGTATLYCVSADGGIVDSTKVTVYPDKDYLEEIVNLCDNSTVLETEENIKDYKEYMGKLDLAYTVLYDEDMASQTTCDTYAQELLTAFYRVGGFVGINSVKMLATNKKQLKSDYVTVQVGSTSNYKNYSYDFDYQMNPRSAMYKSVEWKSSNSLVAVDKNGKCTPTENKPCSAVITCTVTDYMGDKASASATVCFTRSRVTGVTVSPSKVTGGKVGETRQLTASITPSGASCKDVTWVSSDDSIASVDQNGLVTFKYGGDCEISCISNDGGIVGKASINVITNYDLLKALINEYDDYNLSQPNYYPDTWEAYTSARKEALEMVQAQNSNQKQVDAMYKRLQDAYNGLKKYNYIQKVELYLDGEPTAEFYQYDLALLKDGIKYTNAKLDLNVRLFPNNASYQKAEWTSETSDITVTSDGVASPTSNKSCYGKIVCTVTDHFGNEFSDSVWVSFSRYPVTALVLSDTNINGEKGSTYQMSCTVEPTGQNVTHIGRASITDYYWESDDESIATIDENGLVTFVGAGSTKIRAVSYDGGISAECKVSTEGDRSALKDALEEYKDIDLSNYEPEYANAFKTAYQNAENALTNYNLTQREIDNITTALIDSVTDLESHLYTKIENITLSYSTYKKSTSLGSFSNVVANQTIGSNDAVSINLASNYTANNTYNKIVINGRVYPNNARYKSSEWKIDEAVNMTTEIDKTSLTCTPSNKDNGGWVKATISYTDDYNRITSRTVYITMTDKAVSGISIDETFIDEDDQVKHMYAYDSPYSLRYSIRTVNGVNNNVPEFNKIFWTSSNNSVVSVNDRGIVTPLDKGVATVTAKTLDGGYTASITISVEANYISLNKKISEYEALINSVADRYVYTEQSILALQEAINNAKKISEIAQSSQEEIDAALEAMTNAYNGLVEYHAVTGFEIGYEENENISVPNTGYIRYTETSLYSRQIQLSADLAPNNQAVYKSLEWTSSNEDVTVDEFGLVTNTKIGSRYATITCKIVDDFGNEFVKKVNVSFVKNGVNKVTFSEDSIYGAPQEVKRIEPNLNQNGIVNTVNDCTYASTNSKVATVDAEGNITFISQGVSVITVTSCDGGYVGTINAYTTWDTTALQAAIADAKKIDYTEYAPEYGNAFKSALEEAERVYKNVYALQNEIDEATTDLVDAQNALEGHPFIAPEPTFTAGSEELETDRSFAVDPNTGKLMVTAKMNPEAMFKSSKWEYRDAKGVTASISGDRVSLARTASDSQITLIYTVVDSYDRQTEYPFTIKLVNKIIPYTSFKITVDGVATDSDTYTLTGFARNYTDFTGLKLGYYGTPTNATDPISVEWTTEARLYYSISADGSLQLTSAGKLRQSNTGKVTCTITNADGSVISKDITITIARA